jgi:hypothetical protein
VKNAEICQSGENVKIFQSGLVVMGDLPRWKGFEKYEDFPKG